MTLLWESAWHLSSASVIVRMLLHPSIAWHAAREETDMRTITLALIDPTQSAASLCRGGLAQPAIGSSVVGCNK